MRKIKKISCLCSLLLVFIIQYSSTCLTASSTTFTNITNSIKDGIERF